MLVPPVGLGIIAQFYASLETGNSKRDISEKIRHKLLSLPLPYGELKKLENIKGYRDVRFRNASKTLGANK